MTNYLFILSILVWLTPIIRVLSYNEKSNIGVNLSKGWLSGIVIAELILIILGFINYETFGTASDDILSLNLFVFFRGTIPLIGIMNINDFHLDASSMFALSVIFLLTLLFDYIFLFIASQIKLFLKKSKN
jgi:hypothetical protein